MKIIKTATELQALRRDMPKHASVGFVPTMGCLHAGHRALLETARTQNDVLIASIYVNPTQFNNANDLDCYPITNEADIMMAEQACVDILFMPNNTEMYPNGNTIYLDTNDPLSTVLEGQHRSGHFSGMLTVVMKLFQITQPTKAYFGEKDYQQLALVKKCVADFFLPIEIVECETVREISGLPMSSRNQRLNQKQKKIANDVINLFHKTNIHTFKKTRNEIEAIGVKVDYLEPYHHHLFCAFNIDDIRLIDHIKIKEK